AGVPSTRASRLLSMRLIRPASTLPGPHSSATVAPPATSACTHSVQRTGWTECVQALIAGGATRALECGPGKVLAGLIKRIDKNLDARALGTPADFDAALAEARG
ncbi:MAG TPA: hypothetical protein VM847_10990, partial [Tahibacter sp.]|nr:hypothetical protein [Tahibacter sp.]